MKMLRCILVSLMLAGVSLAMSAPAHAAAYAWSKWGACKFAETESDALAKFEKAIAPMSMPEEVKAEFRRRIVTNSEKGSARTVKPGDHFQEMQSCGGHLITGKDGSRDGVDVKPYVGGSWASIESTEWTYDYQGKRYTLVLPGVCYNWAWEVSDIPVPKEAPPPDCAELYVPVEPGDKLTVTILPAGYLSPRSVCSGIKQGDGSWTQQPCLTCFDVTTVGVTLGFDPDAITHEISVCIEREGKGRSCAIVVEPKDWVDKKFTIKPEWLKWSEKCKGTEFPTS